VSLADKLNIAICVVYAVSLKEALEYLVVLAKEKKKQESEGHSKRPRRCFRRCFRRRCCRRRCRSSSNSRSNSFNDKDFNFLPLVDVGLGPTRLIFRL